MRLGLRVFAAARPNSLVFRGRVDTEGMRETRPLVALRRAAKDTKEPRSLVSDVEERLGSTDRLVLGLARLLMLGRSRE